ncbi:hypothetical protein ACFWGI_33505 [Streptomyces niveus]|uniref:hypothetical protein n=1 Tax=Streptomyces niveus TaxID=193462 RepID=UPI0036649F53
MRRVPALVLGLSVDRPGHDPAGNALAVLTDLRRRAYPAGIVVTGSVCGARPEIFHDRARDMGYRLVFGCRTGPQGVWGSHAGVFLAGGGRHRPDTAEPLVTAGPEPAGSTAGKATGQSRVGARNARRPRRETSSDAHGAQHPLRAAARILPAAVRPPGRSSLGLRPRLTAAHIAPFPAGPPEVRRRQPAMFHHRGDSPLRQRTEHGSVLRAQRYFRPRSRAEHSAGNVQEREAAERCQRRRAFALAARSLLLSFQIAHANRRELASWLDTLQTSAPGSSGTAPRTARAVRPGRLGTGEQ